MDRTSVVDRLAEVAREQAGQVSTAQAKRLGLATDDLGRLARSGDLRRVSRGVYALPGSFDGSREDLIAAWLRLSRGRLPWERALPSTIASHTTAAALHGLGTFPPAAPTFTVRERRFQPTDGSARLYTAQLEPADWQWLLLPEGMRIPATTPARTVVDLAFAGEDRSHVIDALDEARGSGLLETEDVVDAMSRRRRRRGRGSVAWLDSALSND